MSTEAIHALTDDLSDELGREHRDHQQLRDLARPIADDFVAWCRHDRLGGCIIDGDTTWHRAPDGAVAVSYGHMLRLCDALGIDRPTSDEATKP